MRLAFDSVACSKGVRPHQLAKGQGRGAVRYLRRSCNDPMIERTTTAARVAERLADRDTRYTISDKAFGQDACS